MIAAREWNLGETPGRAEKEAALKRKEDRMKTETIEHVQTQVDAPLAAVAGEGEQDALMDLVQSASAAETRAEDAAKPLQEHRDFLGFYGLRENPFSDSVNPAFFYRTDAHGDALQQMLMAVEYDVSLGLVVGPSGTGKTLITQLLLQSLPPEKYEAVLALVSPGLSKTGLLREILSELSVALPAGINRTHDLIKLLSNHIIDLYQEGRKLVMLIDECHFLSADNLHVLRTISNIEVPERKLTTCLLFGEERFAARLKHPSFDSLRNRMFMRSVLGPMSVEDAAQYVKFRLMVAGRTAPLFEDSALAALHACGGGVGRTINRLGMIALLEGFAGRKPLIDADIVIHCAQRLQA